MVVSGLWQAQAMEDVVARRQQQQQQRQKEKGIVANDRHERQLLQARAASGCGRVGAAV